MQLSKKRNGGWFFATVFIITFATFAYVYLTEHPTITPPLITLPADGSEHEAFRMRLPWPAGNVTEDSESKLPLRLLAAGTTVKGIVQAPVMPTRSRLHLDWRFHQLTLPITFVLDPNDSYGDGTPDFLRLHTPQDRQAFRNWFTLLAEAQMDQRQLPAEINDCAALLRFAYREALHKHEEGWLQGHPTETPPPSVQQYNYPQTPLGANLFRVKRGPFLESDLRTGAFAQFADAHTLIEWNTFLVGRDLRLAQPGDLIFYRQLEQDAPYDDTGASIHSPFHSMIVCGANSSSWVVYHTGPLRHGKGEMRRLALTDLLHHPDARWRPVRENANFLGVYRWDILREGE